MPMTAPIAETEAFPASPNASMLVRWYRSRRQANPGSNPSARWRIRCQNTGLKRLPMPRLVVIAPTIAACDCLGAGDSSRDHSRDKGKAGEHQSLNNGNWRRSGGAPVQPSNPVTICGTSDRSAISATELAVVFWLKHR